MKRNLKRITSAIAALTVLGMGVPSGQFASIFPVNVISASAAEITESGKCGDAAYYTLDEDGLLTIKGTGSIKSGAFANNSQIKNVIIEDGITSVGDNTFKNCSALETITLSESVTSIGNYAFIGCRALETIYISEGVTYIGDSAFAGCKALETITIPKSVSFICNETFYECSALETIIIPENVTYISSYTFYGCSALEKIYCYADPKNLTWNLNNGDLKRNKGTICYVPEEYYSAYVEKFGNLNVTFDKLYKCGDAAYYTLDEDGLLTIRGTGSIYPGAFSDNNEIKSVIIEDGITSISKDAFNYCTSLETITIPESVTSIDKYAFSYCRALETINIPESVTSIGIATFYCCTGLKTINIPKNVTSIGNYAFYSCSSLETIYIPENVTSIGNYTFSYCGALKTITIPEGVTSISDHAFYSCSSLETITIPESVTSISDYAFAWCEELETITIPEGITSISDHAFAWCEKLETITIPKGVTSIGNFAFYNCSSLETITIPEGVTSIGNYAFYSCSSLETIAIPEGVTSISYAMFVNCIALKTITIPESITTIGSGAFYLCNTLETITIPEGVTSIGDDVFHRCTSLEKMYCYADPENLTWKIKNVDLKPNKGTTCYVPAEYYSAYVEKFGNSNITFNVMPISIEENATYASVIESIDLNAQIPGNADVSFSLSEGSSLPDGLTLADGVISGTPEVTGDFTAEFDILIDDSNVGKLECTFHIAKAEPEVSVTLNKEKVTVLDVITENDFTVEKNVNGKMEWEGLGGELAEGEVSFAWTFTPDDTNYLPASGTVAVNVELPKIEGVQYNVAYDLSEYDFEHIRGISIEFSGQADYTTSGSAVLGNYAFSTALNSNTVSGNNIYIAIDQYSLQSAPDTLTIYDWYNTEATLGDITVTFYYMEDEEVELADSSDILYNADNAIADQFDLSEYDHENVKSVTLVFDGVVYSGYGAITVDENGGFPYNFSMNRSKGNSITIDINGTMSDTLTFFNHYNLRNINYIALNY